MLNLNIAYNTKQYEVAAELNSAGRVTRNCAQHICNVLDNFGFVIIPHLQTEEEANVGLRLVQDAVADPNRERGDFASQTDILYERRDFCPLPSSPQVLSYASLLCYRLKDVLLEYCGTTRKVLEISTMTSYQGCSHQYLHRDPDGVLCLFSALDDISLEQGGTVFVPGTHKYSGSELQHEGDAGLLMTLAQTLSNYHILRHNLKKMFSMRKSGSFKISKQEFRDRVFSTRYDNHQPNLINFFLRRNDIFDLFSLLPHKLLKLYKNRKYIREHFPLVQVSPKKGSIILYRSDMLHAGPDNSSIKPRFFFGMSIARDVIFDEEWRNGYAPHTSLLAEPKSLGDLLKYQNK
ncbi:MAG: phytanoyl-CoA dioxygenase family protein [Gammaproteobacteria bacterium]|nr:phytanoyl-CoA dioxygenase family protein [Gammaproteobacteria bacterium]